MLGHSIKQQIIQRSQEGRPLREIAAEFNLSPATVHKYVRHIKQPANEYERTHYINPAVRTEMMKYAANRNYVIKGLADRYNVPLAYMKYLRRKGDEQHLTVRRFKR